MQQNDSDLGGDFSRNSLLRLLSSRGPWVRGKLVQAGLTNHDKTFSGDMALLGVHISGTSLIGRGLDVWTFEVVLSGQKLRRWPDGADAFKKLK